MATAASCSVFFPEGSAPEEEDAAARVRFLGGMTSWSGSFGGGATSPGHSVGRYYLLNTVKDPPGPGIPRAAHDSAMVPAAARPLPLVPCKSWSHEHAALWNGS